MRKHPALKHFRHDSPGIPHLWCPGCGIGQVWYATAQAIDELKLDTEKVLWVGGSGCSGRMCTYWNGDFFHTLHGRALPFASGAKIVNPDLNVFVHSGDGECMAIGGNHLIHAARRNIDLNVISVNNYNYGMTGGQFSPTTAVGTKTATSPFGNIERPFDLIKLAEVAGATYVARWTTGHPLQVVKALKKAVHNKGFSFVEVVSQCPTQYGKSSRIGGAIPLMKHFKELSVPLAKARGMSAEDLEGKIVVGEFVNKKAPEYTESIHEINHKLQEAR